MKKVYKIIDNNGDGKLSRPEFTRMLYLLDNGDVNDNVKLEFLAADKDYSGELSVNEII